MSTINTDDIAKLLKAGLEEVVVTAKAGELRDYADFVNAYAYEIGSLAERVAAGDEAARVALWQLREMAITSAFIDRYAAQGVARHSFSIVIGTVIRAALGVVL